MIKKLSKFIKRVIKPFNFPKQAGTSEQTLKDIIIISLNDGNVCGKKGFMIEGLSKNLIEMNPQELNHFLKGYFNSLNIGFPIEVVTFMEPVSREQYIKDLERKISTFELMLENNPSADSVKEKLRFLKTIHTNVAEKGLPPLNISSVFYVFGCAPSIDELVRVLNHRVKLMTDTLTSLGFRVTPLNSLKIEALKSKFFRSIAPGKESIKSKLIRSLITTGITISTPALSVFFPFLVTDPMRNRVITQGITLGRNIMNNNIVYWNIGNSISPHILVVGPTGSGKTEFMSLLVERFHTQLDSASFVLDVKGEYAERLNGRRVPFKSFRVGEDAGIGLCRFSRLFPQEWRAGVITEIIVNGFDLAGKKDLTASIYQAIEDSIMHECDSFWDTLVEFLILNDDKYAVYRCLDIVRRIQRFDKGKGISDIITDFFTSPPHESIILDLSLALCMEPNIVNVIVEVISRTIQRLTSMGFKVFKNPRLMVFDEGWMYIKKLNTDIASLLRLGRSHGISVGLATQHVTDIKHIDNAIINNIGLLVAMASPDSSYWQSLKPYMRIRDDDIYTYTALLGRGEGVVRISPNPRPIAVSFR